jgi:DNA-binding PucR family transcriptional regulator
VRPRPGHGERVLAAIAQEFPGALAAARSDRVEALLPVPPGGDPDSAAGAARRLARRLRRSTPTGLSPFEPDVEALGAALRVAELAAELSDVELDDLLSASWRLVLATGPHALQALVDSTVGPATDLLDTLRAYLTHGANMNATANAVYAHRHTVASRLERVRALTGHDPQTPLGQAQLALGLQALDVQRAAASVARKSGLLPV